MGVFDDYITGLEGQTEIDPLEVARNLSELHEQEITTRDAKISEMTETIAARDGVIADRDKDIVNWKARNHDLMLQIPGAEPPATEPDAPEPSEASFDTFFKEPQ